VQVLVLVKKTIIITADKAKHYWDEFEFKDYNCILLSKTVKGIYDLVVHGIPMKELNIGGVSQKDPDKDLLVTKSVYMNKEDVDRLVELREKYGVEDIYFQATPSAPRTELNEVVSKF